MQNNKTTEEAARLFAQLADKLHARGLDKMEVQQYLTRLAFYLFAEDVDLLPGRPLRFILEHARDKPDLAQECIRLLFEATSTDI